MTGDFSLQTDDLVMFFADAKSGGKVVNRWLPKAVYTAETLRIDPDLMSKIAPSWQGAIVTETDVNGGGAWFLANLNQIKTQDSGASQWPKEIVAGDAVMVAIASAGQRNKQPQKDDLVVVPYSPQDKGTGYLITRDIYYSCPKLPDVLVADLEFLAIEDGVVFANVPKPEPFGISCTLLGLNNLRSAALPIGASAETDKTTLARLVRSQP